MTQSWFPCTRPRPLDEASTAATRRPSAGSPCISTRSCRGTARAPLVEGLADSPALLRWAAGKTAKTRADDGELTVSMLQGERGNGSHRTHLSGFLPSGPVDAVFCPTRSLWDGPATSETAGDECAFSRVRRRSSTPCREPWRSRSWETLRERGGRRGILDLSQHLFCRPDVQSAGNFAGANAGGSQTALPSRVGTAPGTPFRCPWELLSMVFCPDVRTRDWTSWWSPSSPLRRTGKFPQPGLASGVVAVPRLLHLWRNRRPASRL